MPASRKRRLPSSSSPSPTDDAAHAPSKRRKTGHPTVPPPRFWDGLSTIPLTANALRELNRRNTRPERKPIPHLPPARRSRRLRAQRVIAQDNNSHQLADRFLRRCSPGCLTRVKKLATHGGPDLRYLRGYQASYTAEHGMRSSTTSSLGRRKRGSQSSEKGHGNANTATTRSTGPYDRTFQQHLIDHGIYPDRYEYPDHRVPPRPDNLDDIRNALGQPRSSLSPSRFSNSKFDDFQRADAHASKESQVVTDVLPLLEGEVRDRRCVARQVPFTDLDPLTDGTLFAASPDLYYGARPEQLDRRIREKLSKRIVPSTQTDLPVAPNFFVEVKGPDGSAAVAKRQVIYDMAIGERGLVDLDAYGTPGPIHDNQTHTIGCTYQDGTLKMYASHIIPPLRPGATPEYVLTQVDSWSLTGNPRSFREGAAAYRNGRDWAKRTRDEAIEQANQRAGDKDLADSHQEDGLQSGASSEASAAGTTDMTAQDTITNHGSNAPSFYNSDTSADELSLDHGPPNKQAKRHMKILPRSNRSRQVL